VQRSAAAEVQPSGTPPQRRTEDAPAQPTPESLSQSSVDDLPSLPEQSVDLFTALRDAGMIPSSPSDSAAAPQVSRRAASDVTHTLANAAPPDQSQITPVESAAAEAVPSAEDSTDGELLSLLNLPPTTPVIRQEQSSPVVSRSISPTRDQRKSEPAEPVAQSSIMSEQSDDWGSIMRAETTAPAESAAPARSTSEEGDAPQEDVNVDKLARDVLDVLRQRLRIEQERRGGRP
jgi:hypothetical protein